MVTEVRMGFLLGVGSYRLEGVQGAFREAGNVHIWIWVVLIRVRTYLKIR